MTKRMDLKEVLARAREAARPSSEEVEMLQDLAGSVLSSVREVFGETSYCRQVTLEGSFAKGTWIRQNPEVDVFVHFDPSLPIERLEEVIVHRGTEAIRRVGGEYRLRYAEHPYVEGTFGKVRVNIVGCYDVEPGRWLSPVDRTPYHTRYIISKINDELRDDVRALKLLLMSNGIYGAEVRVNGFSGYLSELLIIAYQGLEPLIRDASRWKPPIVIDVEHCSSVDAAIAKFPNSPLVVIDPVDRNRNVASAVSLTRLSQFIITSALLLAKPSLRFFEQRTVAVDVERLREELGFRNVLMLKFELKGYVPPDVLWGELNRSLRGIKRALESEGFQVYRSQALEHDGHVVLLFELNVGSLPSVYKHVGPPVYMRNAIEFVEKHDADESTVAGPWVEGDRIYVLKKRKEVRADAILLKKLSSRQVAVSRELFDLLLSAKVSILPNEIFAELSSIKGGIQFLQEFLRGSSSPAS